MDWLAKVTLPYIVVIAVALFAIRAVLGRHKSSIAKSAAEIVESLLIAVVLVFLVIRPFVVQSFYIPTGSMEPTLLGHDTPTPAHDHILVNKFVYRFRDPQRGDIVVFKSPPEASPDGTESDFIKRLIGIPGDVISVTPGYVVIDGAKYDHSDLREMLPGGSLYEMPTIKLTQNGAIVNGKAVSTEEFARMLGQPNAKGLKIIPGKVIRNGKALDEPYTMEDPDYEMAPVKVPAGRLFMMGDNRNNSLDSHAWGTLDANRVIGKSLFRFWPLNRIGLPR